MREPEGYRDALERVRREAKGELVTTVAAGAITCTGGNFWAPFMASEMACLRRL